MRPALFAAAAAFALTSAPLLAQAPATSTPAAGMQDPQAMMAAYEAAMASARRPGDEDLDCEQLQEQLAGAVNDPAVQAMVQSGGEQAQKDMAAMEQGQAEVAGQTAITAAGSLVPGASAAAMAATAANAEAAKARGADRLQSRMALGAQMTASLPAMMRGQRLIELGVAKKCEWAEGIDPAAVAVNPAK